MKRREREEACYICGHYHDYEGGEPCSTCGHRLECNEGHEVHPPSVLPTEIIPGFLFLGSYDHVSRSDLLKTLGIQHILNTVPSCPNLYKNSFDYFTVTTSPPSLEECFQYIESIRAKNEKVIVHCMSGNSRSPSVVAYYLMRAQGLPLQQAFGIVQQKRPSVVLKPEEIGRLQLAEQQLAQSGQQQQQQQGNGADGPFHWGVQMNNGINPQQQHAAAVQPQLNFVPEGFRNSGFVFGAPH